MKVKNLPSWLVVIIRTSQNNSGHFITLYHPLLLATVWHLELINRFFIEVGIGRSDSI